MRNIQVFIMGAGKGSRLRFNLGKKMPKCLLPICMISPEWCVTSIGETILSRIVKSFREAELHGDYHIEIDLLISHKSREIRDYIVDNFPDINLHQIDWSDTSITTFMKCIDILQNKDKQFDQCIFINGDTYISSVELFSITLNHMIADSRTSAIVECFLKPTYIFSNVRTSQDNDGGNLINYIYGDYIDTKQTLCDVTQFNLKDLDTLYNKFKNGFKHEWWEMAFYEEVNNQRMKMSAIPVYKVSDERILYNTNNINDTITRSKAFRILDSFGLNFEEEETFDVKENV